MKAPSHPNEAQRLAALERYDVLDTPSETDYDDVTRLASAICEAPISVINLIDRDRQWFKSEVGLGVRETPLDTSICAHAILQDDFMLVPDTLQDERFRDNPLCAAEPHLRFYAGALLKTPDGFPIGTLCVLDHRPRDLTPLQRQAIRTLANQVMAQLELRRALAEQHRLAQTLTLEAQRKDEFIVTLAHELLNPLAPISTALGVLDRTDAPNGPARSARDVIRRQSGQLDRLVKDLLDAARVRQGKIALQRARVVLSTLIGRAVETSAPAVEIRKHRLVVDLPDQEIGLDADEVRLAQVLSNLLNNAARYTPEGGLIRVVAAADDRFVQIRVIDNGLGIAPESLEHIFGLFEQGGHASGKGGLGIGLTLARTLVELHGGQLLARSDGIGRGSEFEVRLPLSREVRHA